MRQVSPGTRRWTRREYERLVETGFFRPGEPIELIGGELRVAEPQGEPHAVAGGLIGDALRAAFGPGWIVREDKPICTLATSVANSAGEICLSGTATTYTVPLD